MSDIEVVEIIDPPSDAMCRTFHCCVCDKQHLQTGKIARVWVFYADGYSSQASVDCCDKIGAPGLAALRGEMKG